MTETTTAQLVPQPFDLVSAADTVTPLAAYDPDSARCQQYGPAYFMGETDLSAYLRGASAIALVYDLNRSTGQWTRRDVTATPEPVTT